MDFYIVIPAYNEEAYIAQTLQSLADQTFLPKQIIVVDDNSTDQTYRIVQSFSEKYDFITVTKHHSDSKHLPGSKVIKAFYRGLEELDDRFDILCKFDADLIFPENYLERLSAIFDKNPNCGMAGGFCYIDNGNDWVLENLTNKDHIRGALKAYRKSCYQQIGGLKKAMGWDTVDELLAQFYGWEVITDESLHVKHLKPTGQHYADKAGKKQGEAFKKMRYGFLLTLIAAGKLALKKKSLGYFFGALKGFLGTHDGFLVTQEEGSFIRNLRWNAIRKKLF
ncbi:MAG: glycosyltransferase family 2 protein [Flavobacteriaceae bacterium]|nr:glycosyltransferase family 2 protein [Flavobacteriaceae bacterium]